MKKKSFSKAKNYRCKTRKLAKFIKSLKKQRSKKARRDFVNNIYKTDGSRDVI